MNFDHLIGNEEVKTILTNTILNQKLAHSYLFIGPSGVRKNSFC